ncbi:MAG: restriction endonuclease subunit S [Cyanobacteria bacterium J06633_8]
MSRFKNFKPILLSEILEEIRKPVNVILSEEYKQIGIRSHGLGIFHKEPVSGEQLGNKSVFWVEPNCLVFNIVFAWEGAVALTSNKEVGMIASHRFPMYKSKLETAIPEYLRLFFTTSYGKHLLALASPGGAGRNKTLGKERLLRVKVNLPSVPEQKKIAEILGTWDSAITVTENLIAAKLKLRNTLQNKLFTFKEASYKKIGHIAHVKSGSTPLRSKYEEYFENGKIPWVKTMDLNNSFIYKTDELITQKAIHETSCTIFPKEAVLVAMYGGFNQIGRTGLLKVDAAVNQAISAIQLNQAVVIPEYLLQYLNAKVGYWQRFAASSRKDPNITRKDVCDFPIQIPSILEQKNIVDVLKTSDFEIEALKKYHNLLRVQKRGLMQKLLTGEWRVKIEKGNS